MASSEDPTTDVSTRRPVVSSRTPRRPRKLNDTVARPDPRSTVSGAGVVTPVTVEELSEDDVVLQDQEPTAELAVDEVPGDDQPGDDRPVDEVVQEPAADADEDVVQENEPTLVDLSRDDVLAAEPFADGTPATATMDAEDRIITAARPARPRKRRRWHRWLFALLAVVVVMAVLVSTVGVALAESYVRSMTNERVSASLSRTFDTQATAVVQDPSVLRSIFRKKEIEELTFEAPDASMKSGSKTLKFLRITGSARNITDPRDAEKTVIGALDADAEMDYAQLSKLAGIHITHDTGDRVKFDKEVSIFLAKLTITVTARPVLDPATGKITLEDPKARASRVPVPAGIIKKALKAHEDKLVLPPLNGLIYESLVADEKGATIRVSGRDILLKDLEQK